VSPTTFPSPVPAAAREPSIGPVLVAYDGSPVGERALERAAAVVGRHGSVTVVNVLSAQSVGARLETVSDERRARQRELLAEAGAVLARCHVTAEVVGAAGDPVAELLRAVDEHGTRLLVVGHGRGRTRHPLRGSVALRLLRAATCDVLVVA
jgi:nucleotide-binding universal stress UspA family protein